jgi:hypothetical protein
MQGFMSGSWVDGAVGSESRGSPQAFSLAFSASAQLQRAADLLSLQREALR